MSTLVISWCLHYWRNLTWLWQWLFLVKKLGYVCQLMCIIVRKILLRWEAGLPMLWKYNNTSWFVPLDFFQKKKAYLPTQQTMLPRDYSKLRIKYNVHTRHLCSRERNKTKRQQRKRERIISSVANEYMKFAFCKKWWPNQNTYAIIHVSHGPLYL